MFSSLSDNWVVFLIIIRHSTEKYDEARRLWGGGIRGNKSTQMMRKRAKAAGQNVAAASLGKL